MSDSGWVAGRGRFDPTGSDPAYDRNFLIRLGAADEAVTPGTAYQGTAAVAVDGRTTAELRGGTASSTSTVQLAFNRGSQFNVNGHPPVGDVLDLTGTGSDTFVLELVYDDTGLTPGDEMALFLQWLDPADNTWKNAVLGNTPPGGTAFVGTSYDDYLTAHANTFTLGDYGNDATTNTV